jgi:hypothetical protein
MAGTSSMKGDSRLVHLDAVAAKKWDRFVDQHPNATANHLSAWGEILKKSYRFEPVYLGLEGPGGEISGILPLVYKQGPVSGARVTSLPVVRWAGPLGRTTGEEAVLLDAACEFVRSGKASRLHVHGARTEGYDRLLHDLVARPAWPSWWVELPPEPDAFWERFKGRSGNVRRDVKKAQRSGVSVREGESSSDVRRFYHLYLKTMRKHGTLPRTLRQFIVSQRLLGPPGIFKLFVAEYEDRVIAGGVFHFFRDTVDLLYAASDDRYLDVRPNHAVYWEAIRFGIARGFRRVDLGAARPGSSLADFKRRWSAEPVPRFHYTYPAAHAGSRKGHNRTEQALRIRAQLGGGEGTALPRAWRRAPLVLTRLGGVFVYRYL